AVFLGVFAQVLLAAGRQRFRQISEAADVGGLGAEAIHATAPEGRAIVEKRQMALQAIELQLAHLRRIEKGLDLHVPVRTTRLEVTGAHRLTPALSSLRIYGGTSPSRAFSFRGRRPFPPAARRRSRLPGRSPGRPHRRCSYRVSGRSRARKRPWRAAGSSDSCRGACRTSDPPRRRARRRGRPRSPAPSPASARRCSACTCTTSLSHASGR